MLSHQKELFDLPDDIIYLNGAYMGAQLKNVEAAGIIGLKRKSHPYLIKERDFFEGKEILKQRFARLLHCADPESVAIIPSVSYGIANALENIPFERGDEIVVLEEQFPSNYYAWKRLEELKGVKVIIIQAPPVRAGRGKLWNEMVYSAISNRTRALAVPQVHWADGTLFDLKALRKRTDEVDAYLIVDGTQSIGAMPFSIPEIRPDALICGGYKWLLGPYSLGMAYYGPRFYDGIPIEDNWMNHHGAENFSELVRYDYAFKPAASRYEVGESSNFILVPMLSESIRQVISWTPSAIQEYCGNITQQAIEELSSLGYFIEEPQYRGAHLFGIYLPDPGRLDDFKQRILAQNIYVSYRGNAIRVSPHLYNTKKDMEKLVSCFR